MEIHWDPSHAWDSYADEMDRAEAEGSEFCARNREAVVRLVCAILSNPKADPFYMGDIVDQAVKVALRIEDACGGADRADAFAAELEAVAVALDRAPRFGADVDGGPEGARWVRLSDTVARRLAEVVRQGR